MVNNGDGKIKITVGYEYDADNISFYFTPKGLFKCIKDFASGFTSENGKKIIL